VIIDGTTQPGWAGSPIIELDGSGGLTGLLIFAGNSTVKGLVINRFGGGGILLRTNGGNIIQGNYIGTDVSGTMDMGNVGNAGIIIHSNNNIIGGTTGTTPGGPCTGECNVISGNRRGILIDGNGDGDPFENVMQGNYIGTDVTGMFALGNDQVGIDIRFDLGNNKIGGTEAGAGNLISGNGFSGSGHSGVDISASAGGNVVQGNLIGTNVNGTSALGNGEYGLELVASNNIIGGTTGTTPGGPCTGSCNVISGNAEFGILIRGGDGNVVQGNYIGTDVSGSADLGNALAGVRINAGDGNTIGGTEAGAGNVISGNDTYGISTSGNGNLVQGNLIGTDVSGTSDLGNTLDGIWIFSGSDAIIGGAATGAGNTIAFNGRDGVFVQSGSGNLISSNSIHTNDDLGIDLGTHGVRANDPNDVDVGPNLQQNYPTLTLATSGPATTTIDGDLDSTPSTTFTIEFFSNIGCDPSGNGEGQSFLGSTMVMTDVNGDVSFSVSFGSPVPTGQVITATATDPSGNTSEFSACEPATLDSDDDGVPDTTDPDDDGDGVHDVDEGPCGSNSLDATSIPERLDGAFATTDDDGDAAVDEALPSGSESFDCDGDGWSGADEMLIFSAGTTANDQDPCGNNGWPADLDPNNTLDIGDFNSFLFPLRGDGSFNKFDHPVPDASDPDIARWDLDAGDGIIDIGDINAINPAVLAPTARPPMFGGQPAFLSDVGNGVGGCPWPP